MKQVKRGYVPGDEKEFCTEELEKLRKASKHIRYLMNEGYAVKNASVFVGNHFLLSERQRLALVRSISTEEQLSCRRQKECRLEHLQGQTVHIDGFNTIITLEIALSNSLLLQCMDGTIRDLAGLRGTYRLIDKTDGAIRLIAEELKTAAIKKAVFYLDAPVSNSGRLKSRIADIWEGCEMELDIEVRNDVDKALYEQNYVITADAMILDRCKSWCNPVASCLEKTGAAPVRVW